MRAVRYHGNKDVRLDDVPEPTCKPGWVKIKNGYSGICGSVPARFGYLKSLILSLVKAFLVPLVSPRPCAPSVFPYSLLLKILTTYVGHEFSGTIVEVGEGVSDLNVGQKAAIEPAIADGTCASCREGMPNTCDNLGLYGYSGWEGGGGMAEYMIAPPGNVHVVPDNMSLEIAALVEPLTVPWRAVKAANFQKGQTALILGAGPIGLMTVLCLQAFGAATVLVSDPSEGRRELAKQLGADRVFNPLKEDVQVISHQLCDGRGPHVIFECAGVQQSLTTAIQAVRKTGVIVGLALWETKAEIDPNRIVFKQITYMGAIPYVPGDFQEVIQAIDAGRIRNPERLITAKIDMEDVVPRGFEALLNNKSENVKILISPTKMGV